MTNLDKIIEYLHYHPGANRRELMESLALGLKDTKMKFLLGEAVANGDIRVEGKARATRYFITPKAQLLRTIDLGCEAAEDMCTLVNGKSDPYEKALLTLMLIAYIQPFTDGNKRTSRLMANALLISRFLCPLSFRTVEANDYRAALLLFYEQNNLSAFKKMFLEQVEFAMKEYF